MTQSENSILKIAIKIVIILIIINRESLNNLIYKTNLFPIKSFFDITFMTWSFQYSCLAMNMVLMTKSCGERSNRSTKH